MLINKKFTVREIGIELRDVGLGVGDVGGAAEVVTMIEEDVLDVGRVRWDIAITRPGIVRVFGLVPLDRWTRRRTRRGVALWSLHPSS